MSYDLFENNKREKKINLNNLRKESESRRLINIFLLNFKNNKHFKYL